MRCGKGVLSSGGVNALQRTHWRRGLDTVFPPSTVVLLTMCKSIADDFAISTKRVEMPVFLDTSERDVRIEFCNGPKVPWATLPFQMGRLQKMGGTIFFLKAIPSKLP